jgi:ferredoxin
VETTIRKVLVPRFGDESVLQVIEADIARPQPGEVQVRVRGCYECMVRRRTARGKFGRGDKSAQMYSAFGWRVVLLAMMSCARVCPFKTRRSLKTIRNTRLRTRRCDCSFVVTYPMQTSVEKLQAVVVVVWESGSA